MTKATKYIRNIKKVDYINAKQYLERNGWKVVLFNTPSGNTLIDKLGLQEYAKRMDGFVYDVNCLKYVFINGQHIELKQDLTALDKLDEANAWRFAYDVLFYTKNIIHKVISDVVICVITASLIFTYCSVSDKLKNSNQTVYVTSSGERFHTENCYFVQGKEALPLKAKEAQKHYEPCAFCNPDK